MTESPFARRVHEGLSALAAFGEGEGTKWRIALWESDDVQPVWTEIPDQERGAVSAFGRVFTFQFASEEVELGRRHRLAVRLAEGEPLWMMVEQVVCWRQWNKEGWCFSPSALYGGCRFEAVPASYPPIFPWERTEDGPPLVTDVPRLGLEGERRVEMLSGDMAVPAFGVLLPESGLGSLVFSDCRTAAGWTGMTVEEDLDAGALLLRVQTPGVRSSRYRMMDPQGESPDRPAWMLPGEEILASSTVFSFSASSPDDVLKVFSSRRNEELPQGSLRCVLPLSEAFSILERKYLRDNWNREKRFFGSETGEDGFSSWQPGWVGGGMSSLPLMVMGSPESKEKAESTLDFLTGEAQSPSGFFYGIYDREGWKGDGFGAPHADRWALVRKSADALYFLGRQIRWKEQQGEAIASQWRDGLARGALALARVWQENGSFGQFLDVDTGRITVNGSTSGAMAPGAMRVAAQLLSDSALAEAAEASGLALAERAVREGFTTGGPGEALQCPDSESCAGLLESLVVLWEHSGKTSFLELALAVVRQLSTWVVPYDFPFPPDTLFGRLDMQTTGTVVANVQNRHSAPAPCTHSPSALVRLWRATGDALSLELAVQISRTASQYLSRSDRKVGPLREGWMCERVNMSDWELGGIEVGGVFDGSCWCEVSLLLTAMEIPGIYLRPRDGLVIAFDHVVVEETRRIEDGWEALVSNPTPFPARVRVWTDHDPALPSPDWFGTSALSQLDLAPGQSRILRF